MKKLSVFLLFFVVLTIPSYAEQLKVTPEHPFYLDGEWVEASELKPGDKLKTIDGKIAVIKNIRKVKTQEPVTVYNLEASSPHNYFADGVLVHNKAMEFQQTFRPGKRVNVARSDGKVSSGIVNKVYPDGRVEVIVDKNKFDIIHTLQTGDDVVIPRSDGTFSAGKVMLIDTESGVVDVSIDSGRRHKIISIKEIWKRDGSEGVKKVPAPQLSKTSPPTTLADSIENAISQGEIKAIDSWKLNKWVKDVYKIENHAPVGRGGLIHDIKPSSCGATIIEQGKTYTYVLTKKGILRIANKRLSPSEIGIKHIQLSLGDDVVYAGEMVRETNGAIYADLQSGTYSNNGRNLQFSLDDMNNRANLKAFLQKAMPRERIRLVEKAR